MSSHRKAKARHTKPDQPPAQPVQAYPYAVPAAPPLAYPPPYSAAPFNVHRNTAAAVMQTGDAAVAEVYYEVPVQPHEVKEAEAAAGEWGYPAYPQPKRITGAGTSKREREDNHDPVTGEILAVARAYDELAARLFREARGRIRAQDSDRRQRQLRRSREEWEAMQAKGVKPERTPRYEDSASYKRMMAAREETTEAPTVDATVMVRDHLKDVVTGLESVVQLLS